ncbi:DoxX family protein [Ktedonosporobacter rubrisoli]|nr:DoxX family membrane protein [Ktedonosporobacter rubrisoli]
MFKTLGHALLGSMFIVGGAGVLAEPDGRVAKVEAAGIPQPRQATILNATVMVLAGSALAMGIMPRLSAAMLAAALIPTTMVGHPFWKEEATANRATQRTHFMKNIAMLGGLLLVLTEKDD